MKVIILMLAICLSGFANAKVFMTIDQSIVKYFPGCNIKQNNIFLTEEQIKVAQAEAGFQIESKILNQRIATCSNGLSYIYFDAQIVRTQQAALMVIIREDLISRVELLSFNEPEEYIPKRKWYEQFDNKNLNNKLEVGHAIPHVAGATLTSKATLKSVRLILALHKATKNE
ncbi:MAG: FMN-binding protein [Bacteriovoracaceae bacterium]|nr:FMN-binding protein [Bacteriovoracaceae bacterium]